MALGVATGTNITATMTGPDGGNVRCRLAAPLGPTSCCARFGRCLDYAYVVLFSRTEIGDPEGTDVTRAVDRASQILLALASGTPRLGVSEISDLIDVPKPTVHTMLRTLERRGLVIQEVDGGKYALGPAVLQLGNAYLGGSELRARSASWSDMLARQAGEAVWVAVLSGPNVVVVHHTLRPDDLVQILEVGAAVPWHASALGRAIVAYTPDDTQKALLASPLRRLTGKTVTDPNLLRQELAAVLTRGYAVEDEEATLGDAGLAAPVFNWSGRVVGALGIVGPVGRLLIEARQDRLADAVRSTARALSRDLGAGRAMSG